mgnify:CR=1 FL=1|tara:strand:+ start:54 stop:488 length:435 start_codon:yes stop_codon:yes gene_type:complete
MKKAQAAMEFLMTYGWTILVVIIAGAALVYFDILNPAKFLPDKCQISGFTCEDFRVNSADATIYISNNIGDDIDITSVSIGTSENNNSISLQMGKSQQIDINISGMGVSAGDRFKETIKIKYSTRSSGIAHTNIGELIAIVEES